MSKIDQLIKELSKKDYKVKRASEVITEPKIRTGVFALDYVLSGGISQCEGGHRIEFFGAESTGKTTFALKIIQKYQELGKICAFIDAEKSYDTMWGEVLGLNNKELLIAYPNSLEEAGNMLVNIIPQVDLLVIDSIIGLIPIGEAERDTEETQVALQARVNALITRKIYHALSEKPITLIFINQQREKVGVRHGYPYTTAGGHALKHMYSTRIEFKTGKPIKDGDEKIGLEVNMICVKNKKGVPHRKSEIDFFLDGSLGNKKSLFYAGLKFSVIEKIKNTYMFGKKKAVGQEKFVEELAEKDWEKIEEELWERIK